MATALGNLGAIIGSMVELLPPPGLVAAPVVLLSVAVAYTCDSLKEFKNSLD